MGMLDGKTAIVTGASSGIGHAAARLFAAEGANVVINARRGAMLDQLKQTIEAAGGHAEVVVGDIRLERTAEAAVERAVRVFGGLDVAFNNAGAVGEMAPTAQLSTDGWRESIEINLTSAFLAAKHQVPAMQARGGGSIIFTSTFVGHSVGMPGLAAYAASKAGLIGLTQTFAVEHGQENIRVNTILPGATDTPSNVVNQSGATAELIAFVRGMHALKRLATPAEIAQAALFFASDASSFITGTAMPVDGGLAITRT